jgi:DNA-binding transcriptional ArsR family regulator
MADKSFVLLSLKDDKAKELSKVLGNATCRKILDYIASKGDATETQISKDLKVPISTVNYNMKLLSDNGIVSANEYHYSEKGKEVIHYKLKNRYIIIAPNSDESESSIMKKLRGIIPGVIVLGVGTLIVGAVEFARSSSQRLASAGNIAMAKSAAFVADEMAENGSIQLMTVAAPSAAPVVSAAPHYTLWFFLGGVFVLLCMLLYNFVKKK